MPGVSAKLSKMSVVKLVFSFKYLTFGRIGFEKSQSFNRHCNGQIFSRTLEIDFVKEP